MSREKLRQGWFAVVLAWSFVACGGSTPAQRGDGESTPIGAGDSGSTGDDAGDASDVGDSAPDGDANTQSAFGGEGAVDDPTDQVVAKADDVGGDGGGGADAPTVKPKPAIDPRFKTSESREKMSAFLVKPAEKAMKDSDFARAISLYSGIVAARGKGNPSALELAKAWNLADGYDEAARLYEEFAAETDDAAAREKALAEAARLHDFDVPFRREFRASYAKKEAIDAYKLGRKAQSKKKWADALVYFQMATAIDPTLPAPFREIGTSYGKLGATEEKVKFLLDYLWRSPVGPFAKDIRAELKKMKRTKELGTVSVKSKLPCEEVWVVGYPVRQKLPIKKLEMAPGTYKWLCYHPRYAMAYFEEVTIEAGKHAELEFYWAIIVNALKDPWGRIAIEDARRKGVLHDLGLEAEELGVVVPADGSALEIRLTGPAGRKQDTRYERIASGERKVIKWEK